jgi:hypothetical protein
METTKPRQAARDTSPLGHVSMRMGCDHCEVVAVAYHDERWHLWSPLERRWRRFCSAACAEGYLRAN